jgi:Ca2+-binding RTX toxin-like protein
MVHRCLWQAARGVILVGVFTAPLLAAGAPVAGAGEPPTCFGEAATIVVSEPEDDVVGTDGPDVMVVTDTDFWTVYGLGGDDRICTDGQGMGGSGDDRLLGFRRTSTVRELTLGGGPGDDRIYRRGPRDDDPHLSPLMRGGAGNDRLEGGANSDHILGGRGRDRIFGGSLWDGLRGGRGKDVIHGEGRGDRMYGGERADRLVGGSGRDSARGGPGVDNCDAELEVTC